MKYLLKFFLVTFFVSGFVACDKMDVNGVYTTGIAPVLSSSVTSVAAAPADSDKVALTLSWTNTKQATDSANRKYTIEIDSAGKNFTSPGTKIVLGSLSTSFTAKDLNTILLNKGYAFNVPVDMDIRMTASYANNNDRIVSNTLRVKMTPYKIPPKVALPSSGKLFLVGDASDGGWINPVPVPSQELVRIDETTFGGVFHLTGGKQFLLLPVNGDWGHKFATNASGTAGNFGFDLNDNFSGPATTGFYKIIVDFQAGTYKITPYVGLLPTNLFIVGDATAGGWNNPVPTPSQQLTRINSSIFKITLPLIGGKNYLLLPVNGDWGHKFAVSNGTPGLQPTGGPFGYDFSDNFTSPATSGTYTITVNFLTNTFSVQ